MFGVVRQLRYGAPLVCMPRRMHPFSVTVPIQPFLCSPVTVQRNASAFTCALSATRKRNGRNNKTSDQPNTEAAVLSDEGSVSVTSTADALGKKKAGTGAKRGRKSSVAASSADNAADGGSVMCSDQEKEEGKDVEGSGQAPVKGDGGSSSALDPADEALNEIIEYLRGRIAARKHHPLAAWKPTIAEQRILRGLDPRVVRQRTEDLFRHYPEDTVREMLRRRPGYMLREPFDDLFKRLHAVGDALGQPIAVVLKMAAAKPGLLTADRAALRETVVQLISAAKELLEAKEPHNVISAVLELEPCILDNSMSEMQEVMVKVRTRIQPQYRMARWLRADGDMNEAEKERQASELAECLSTGYVSKRWF